VFKSGDQTEKKQASKKSAKTVYENRKTDPTLAYTHE